MYGSSSVFALFFNPMLPLTDIPVQTIRPVAIEFAQPNFISAAPIQSFVNLVPINFSDLQPFERVQSQYQAWGIEFDGAIALQPSNSAFQLSQASVGLMPSCDRIPLRIYLQQPHHWMSACLIGAKRITVRAFDASQRLIHEQSFGQSHYLQHRIAASSAVVISHMMQLQASTIARIEISSDAPFILENLCLG